MIYGNVHYLISVSFLNEIFYSKFNGYVNGDEFDPLSFYIYVFRWFLNILFLSFKFENILF